MSKCVMVVGAHADDVEINTGGTLAKYADRGYRVLYVMSTNNMSGHIAQPQPDGSMRHLTENPVAMMARRKGECAAAAAELNATVVHLDHPQRHYRTDDGRTIDANYGSPPPPGIDAQRPTILTAYDHASCRRQLVDLILEHQPQCVFTHGVSENNIEHLATALLVTRSFWEAVDAGHAGAMLHWRRGRDFLGPINSTWETHVDISDQVDRKMRLIGMHRSQLPMAHRPDFEYRVRARQWGDACQCGAAEVFYWVRRPTCPDACPSQSLLGELLEHTLPQEAASVGKINSDI